MTDENAPRYLVFWCRKCRTTVSVTTAETDRSADARVDVDMDPHPTEMKCPICSSDMCDWDYEVAVGACPRSGPAYADEKKAFETYLLWYRGKRGL